ncbi:MAG: hypothetical protein ACK4EX_02375 [Thermaurantimonas sp.]|uniref:hypothetical protein n=1 Tax=Thermaurantimonas TaxID=2681566 RepID=UPI0023F23D33|nr:hypothetical protein [Thermaurantimonas aggregans]MCX8149229.1 hypothetical protein [Thermaurantimonas aggregans]
MKLPTFYAANIIIFCPVLPFDFDKISADIQRQLSDQLPTTAGKLAVDFFKKNFHDEGFTDRSFEPWPEVKRRLDPRTKGAARTRKILTGSTGDLGESPAYRLDQPGSVTIYAEAFSPSGFNYAPVHNYGATDAGRLRRTVIPQRKFIGPSFTLEQSITDLLHQVIASLLSPR